MKYFALAAYNVIKTKTIMQLASTVLFHCPNAYINEKTFQSYNTGKKHTTATLFLLI